MKIIKPITGMRFKELAKIKDLFLKLYEKSSSFQHEFQEMKRERRKNCIIYKADG